MITFDAPLYKILAHNDTGQAAGHQGGIVIPSSLDAYFPQLLANASAEEPTQEQLITADLFDGGNYLTTVEARYQFQTWGGVRSPERRLTRNLGPLRNMAHGGDLLIIERGIEDDSHYRLTLIHQNTAAFNQYTANLGNVRWGCLKKGLEPVKEVEVEQAIHDIVQQEFAPFSLFDPNAGFVQTHSKKVARSKAFQSRVSTIYQRKCAVCGTGLQHPKGKFETHAAHIVPRGRSGSDDARNGLQLCQTHHWAFDAGLFGIDGQYKIIVPEQIILMPQNQILNSIEGIQITLPADNALYPHLDALAWHSANVMFQS